MKSFAVGEWDPNETADKLSKDFLKPKKPKILKILKFVKTDGSNVSEKKILEKQKSYSVIPEDPSSNEQQPKKKKKQQSSLKQPRNSIKNAVDLNVTTESNMIVDKKKRKSKKRNSTSSVAEELILVTESPSSNKQQKKKRPASLEQPENSAGNGVDLNTTTESTTSVNKKKKNIKSKKQNSAFAIAKELISVTESKSSDKRHKKKKKKQPASLEQPENSTGNGVDLNATTESNTSVKKKKRNKKSKKQNSTSSIAEELILITESQSSDKKQKKQQSWSLKQPENSTGDATMDLNTSTSSSRRTKKRRNSKLKRLKNIKKRSSNSSKKSGLVENVELVSAKKRKLSTTDTEIDTSIVKKSKNKKPKLDIQKLQDLLLNQEEPVVSGKPGTRKSRNGFSPKRFGVKPLTLREKMVAKLKSSRFRFINETLYNSASYDAKSLFKDDPESFFAYHEGYKLQVDQWPVNPLDIIIDSIKSMPEDLVIADFGCGEAKLADSVKQQVHSFDLVAINDKVQACDVSHTPLLTSSTNVVVFCLSLMGTNSKDYIIEANRVLKKGGVLKIAEVESRFENVEDFIKAMEDYGFSVKHQDLSHDLFYFLDFKKENDFVRRKKLAEISLRPCLYKKR